MVVGPEGATITDHGGTQLIIPPGALTEAVSISVTTYRDSGLLGTIHPELVGALCGVVLQPSGLQFAVPVPLRITPAADLERGSYPVFRHDSSDNIWVQTGRREHETAGAAIETTITHCSVYSIFDLRYGILGGFGEFV